MSVRPFFAIFFCFKSPKQWTGLFWFQTNFTEPFPFCFICWYVFNWRYVKYLQLLTSILFLTMISTAITSSPPPLTSTCSIRPYVKQFEKKNWDHWLEYNTLHELLPPLISMIFFLVTNVEHDLAQTVCSHFCHIICVLTFCVCFAFVSCSLFWFSFFCCVTIICLLVCFPADGDGVVGRFLMVKI